MDGVIVFDCDDYPEQSAELDQDSPPKAPTNVFEKELRNKRYADLLRLKKVRVQAKNINSNEYEAPEESPSPDKPKQKEQEVVIFNLEEEPSYVFKPEYPSYIPLQTAKFNEQFELPAQYRSEIESSEIFQPEPLPSNSDAASHLSEKPSQRLKNLIGNQESSGSQRDASPNPSVSEYSESSGMMAVFVPKKALLGIQAEFRVERVLLFPQKFHLYLNGYHVITARRKIVQSNSLYFFFSSTEELSTKGNHYLGYMEANFNGTEYNVYTHAGMHLAFFTHLIRKGQPTKSNLYFPSRLSDKSDPIKTRVMLDDKEIHHARTKYATFNSSTKTYSLNFKGRAKLASVKNCVIEFDGYYALIMGKTQEKLYNLDFGVPFSDITAFAFAISNYEEKLGDNAKY